VYDALMNPGMEACIEEMRVANKHLEEARKENE